MEEEEEEEEEEEFLTVFVSGTTQTASGISGLAIFFFAKRFVHLLQLLTLNNGRIK